MTLFELPSSVLSAHGDTAESIVEYLRKDGRLDDDEVLDKITIQLRSSGEVVVLDYQWKDKKGVGE